MKKTHLLSCKLYVARTLTKRKNMEKIWWGRPKICLEAGFCMVPGDWMHAHPKTRGGSGRSSSSSIPIPTESIKIHKKEIQGS